MAILTMFLVGLGVAGYFAYKEYEKQCPEISDKKLINIYTVHEKEKTGQTASCSGLSANQRGICNHNTCTNVEPGFVQRRDRSKTVIGYT